MMNWQNGRERSLRGWGLIAMGGLILVGCTEDCTGGGPTEEGCVADLLAGDLVITEVMADPAGKDDGKEWIEIFNATSDEIDLSGVKIIASRADGTGDADHVMEKIKLGSRSYLVLGDAASSNLPSYVQYGYGSDLGGLRNGGGRISIECDALVVDRVIYIQGHEGYSRSFDGAQSPDAIANDDLEKWCPGEGSFSQDAFGTPGAANASCDYVPSGQCVEDGEPRAKVTPQEGDLIVNELMANPAGTDSGTDKEWFELYVARDVDLNGLKFGKDPSDLEDPDGQLADGDCIRVTGGSYLLFAQSNVREENGGLEEVDFTYSFDLTNSGGQLFVGVGGLVLDVVAYGSQADGVALALDPDHREPQENDDPALWCPGVASYGSEGNLGSPGAGNPSCNIIPAGQCREGESFRAKVTPVAGDLVISEIMANPDGSDTGTDKEWFELYVARAVDLNGLKFGKDPSDLQDPDGRLPEGDCLRVTAGRYALFAESVDPAQNAGLPAVDFTYNFDLTNGGGTLFVAMENIVLDRVTYPSLADGEAHALDPDHLDPDDNDDAGLWCPATAAYGTEANQGTPGAANPSCNIVPPGQCRDGAAFRAKVAPAVNDLVITEFMPNPEGTDGGREWFEIFVVNSVDLNGLQLGSDGSNPNAFDMTLPEGDCLSALAGSYLLFAQGTDPALNGGLPTPGYLFDFTLGNTSAYLFIGYQDQIIDTLVYQSVNVQSGAATSLAADQLSAQNNDSMDNWCFATTAYGPGGKGTPGAANPLCSVPAGQCYDGGNLRPQVVPVVGDLVISEFLADPDSTDTNKEWIEVHVGREVDVDGLVIKRDTEEVSIPSGQCQRVAAGTYLVFAQKTDPAVNGGLTAVDYLIDFTLTNTGDHTITIGTAAEVLDAVGYGSAMVDSGVTTSLSNAQLTATGNDAPENWCSGVAEYGGGPNKGTPGEQNPDCP